MHGNHGFYLRIDLNLNRHELINIDEHVYTNYIGGIGLGAYLLTTESQAGFDPLSPAAPVIIAFSPLVGTPLTTSAKFAIVAKSPLTQRICDAMCSSQFAIAGKKIGVDAICISGALAAPSVLFLENDESGQLQMQFKSTGTWTGASADEVERGIHEKYGQDWQVLAIGRAGEEKIPFATLSHDGRHAGRGGLGAIFGSKNLKALAVRGCHKTTLADAGQTIELSRSLAERSKTQATSKYSQIGTIANLLVFNRFNALPTMNFQSGSFQEADNLLNQDMAPDRRLVRNSCAVCSIGCEHVFELKANEFPSDKPQGVRMEYESLFALGPLCGVSEPELVLQASAACDKYGLDTISTGGTIAFLMECTKRNYISPKLKNSPDLLHFGNGKAVIDLIHEMVSDSPGHLGWLARLGSRSAAALIGHQSNTFAPQVKGMEMPGYHPRRLHAMALGMAVGCRGADHNRTSAYEADFKPGQANDAKSIADAVVASENRAVIMDSMILCKFIRGVFNDFYEESAAMLRAVTGLPLTRDSLMDCAKSIVNVRKRFNQREGWEPEEDWLPEIVFQVNPDEKLPQEHCPLTRERLESLIEEYYQIRGWSPAGFAPMTELKKSIIG